MTTNSNNTAPILAATYASPTNDHFTHTTNLPHLGSTAPSDRAVYLSTLRKACAEMQDLVNKELTHRMDEDNARVAGGAGKNVRIDEKKEEENYGEEVVEED